MNAGYTVATIEEYMREEGRNGRKYIQSEGNWLNEINYEKMLSKVDKVQKRILE